MAQNIEFYLQPPSPTRSEEHHSCTLPPVSSLLPPNDDDDDPISPMTDLPSINLPSPSSSYLEPVEPNALSATSSPSLSPFMSSLSPFMSSLSLDSPPQLSSPQASPCHLLLPPPTNSRRCRSLSNASTSSSGSYFPTRRLSDPPIYCPNEGIAPASPTAKRKRGRPPNTSRQANQRDSWTFVTPTVWNVKHKEVKSPGTPTSLASESQPDLEDNDDFMVLHWPTNDTKEEHEGQSIFTNTSMNTSLSIPKKKRGRKPKVQLAGNFCFVWRDLTAPRGSNKKKSS
ncbi:MAG: hypothetical protein EXX96DRAFT_553767 [Benjaminiella poitrasii]|nr:MAG: hypothetical protein EXX96DRAFT_553767 [Benjaminiella poitrasii]